MAVILTRVPIKDDHLLQLCMQELAKSSFGLLLKFTIDYHYSKWLVTAATVAQRLSLMPSHVVVLLGSNVNSTLVENVRTNLSHISSITVDAITKDWRDSWEGGDY
ncbi:hypothetical protein OSB04_un000244 [Centaurea solstitialis]|uniref:Uncharacterized protein n=1 Tax=Centaurea solstitialis TaxID=347529 RepID=A0AA38S5I6_9ASTR|nr:hypothetical protein OSB04_un000244 [Centaurea solstitialis]